MSRASLNDQKTRKKKERERKEREGKEDSMTTQSFQSQQSTVARNTSMNSFVSCEHVFDARRSRKLQTA